MSEVGALGPRLRYQQSVGGRFGAGGMVDLSVAAPADRSPAPPTTGPVVLTERPRFLSRPLVVAQPPVGSTASFRDLIARYAQQNGLDPALVQAVVAVESQFDPRAVSPAGAKGLMQLTEATARHLGVRDPFDPAENLRGGTAYLARLLQKYRDPALALAAYNAGPAAVDRYGGIPPYRETRTYVQRVLDLYRRLVGRPEGAR